MEMLQQMTLPFYRSGECKQTAHKDKIAQEAIQQLHWDAVGQVAKRFREMKKEGHKGFKVNIHSSFDSCCDSFCSDSGQNELTPARRPPSKEKKTEKHQCGII